MGVSVCWEIVCVRGKRMMASFQYEISLFLSSDSEFLFFFSTMQQKTTTTTTSLHPHSTSSQTSFKEERLTEENSNLKKKL